MIRKYKFTHASFSEGPKLFLTSDTHFCHAKLLENRGFKTVEEHDATIIENWNRVVRPIDTVIHLGDFILGAGDKSKETAIDLFSKLNGNIVMLFGNHNAGVKSIYADTVAEVLKLPSSSGEVAIEVYPVTYNNKVTFVGNSMLAQVKISDAYFSGDAKRTHFVFCSHFAHRIWIDSAKGVFHASGHSHGSDTESNPDSMQTTRLDVGMENFNYTPLGFDKFLELMKKTPYSQLDHHDANTSPSF